MNAIDTALARHASEFAALRQGLADVSADVVARTVLGSFSEPGDGTLGRLVGALGAVRLAEAVIVSRAPAELSAFVAESGETIAADEIESAFSRWRPRLDHGAFARSLETAVRLGSRFVVPGDMAWPRLVDDLAFHAPLGLWVRGDVGALVGTTRRTEATDAASDRRRRIGPADHAHRGAVALVGARAATGYGEHVATECAAGLAERGYTVISGGAYGIDGAAHRASLAVAGITVAFLAGGVDRLYPLGHESLLNRIVDTGAVVSELPCGAAPTKWRFLQRNRLIAAASDATVVLEAGVRSGSLNTAGHAAALGRPLGALPGPVTSPASAGCHRLLREFDAVCVTGATQIAELVGDSAHDTTVSLWDGDLASESGAHGHADRTAEQTRLLDAMSTRTRRSFDEIVVRAGLGTSDAMAALGALDALGAVVEHDDGWVRRRTG